MGRLSILIGRTLAEIVDILTSVEGWQHSFHDSVLSDVGKAQERCIHIIIFSRVPTHFLCFPVFHASRVPGPTQYLHEVYRHISDSFCFQDEIGSQCI